MTLAVNLRNKICENCNCVFVVLTPSFFLSFFFLSESSASEAEGSHVGPVKSKHCEDEDATNAEIHEAKRLKFDKEEEEEDDDDEDEMEKEPDEKQLSCISVAESSSDLPQSSSDVTAEVKENKPDESIAEDQGTSFLPFHNITVF